MSRHEERKHEATRTPASADASRADSPGANQQDANRQDVNRLGGNRQDGTQQDGNRQDANRQDVNPLDAKPLDGKPPDGKPLDGKPLDGKPLDGNLDLAQIYQQVVLRHNKAPHGYANVPAAQFVCRGANPLCGDELVVMLRCDAQSCIVAAGFSGEASALTTAVASMLMQRLPGQSRQQALRWLETVLDLYTRNPQRSALAQFGELNALLPLIAHPNRLKAMTLPIVSCLAALMGLGMASTDGQTSGEREGA